MEALEIRYSNTPNRPTKNAKRAGKYTKGFLKWNRDQIRKGNTTIYADPNKIYNPKTDSFITLKYKKSATKNKILTAASKRIKRNNNVMVNYLKVRLNKKNLPLNDGSSFLWAKSLIQKKKIYDKKTRWVIKNNKNNDIIRSAELPALTEKSSIGNFQSVAVYFNHQNEFNGAMMSPKSGTPIWWWIVYGDPDELIDLENEEVIAQANFTDFDLYITEDTNIDENYMKQVFRGEGDCLLRPIYNWVLEKHDEAKSKDAKVRYATLKNHFHDKTLKSGVVKQGLFSKYPNGVPEEDLAFIAEKCRVKIRIQKPFNSKVFLCAEPTKKPLRTFSYTNTRLNHVEHTEKDFFNNLYTNNFKEDVMIMESFTEMNALAESLEPGSWIGSSNRDGFTTIKTLDTIYRINQDFNTAVDEFEKEIGCNTPSHSWEFDTIKNPNLGKFIAAGTHFNATIDFTDEIQDSMDNLIKQGLRHHDQTKAYANFHASKYYSGFMERPGDFRLTNKLEGKGFYYIYNIEINNDKFKQLNDKLNWFKNHNVYTDAELTALSNYASYKIAAAATGRKTDFRFNKTMKEGKILLHKINNKEIKLPYYSKWVGMCAMNREEQTFLMKGEKHYFENIQEPGHTTIKYDDFFGGARITYPKKSARTLKHIAAQIVAYQRLVMLEKVMQMDINKIVRICVDGIYFWDHDVDFSTPYDTQEFKVWGDKTKVEKMTFQNSAASNYLSNIYDADEIMGAIFELNNGVNRTETLQDLIPLPTAKPRAYYRTEIFTGSGGTGKTTYNLLDDGIIDVCYIAPTWKLARQMEEDFKNKFNKTIDVNVLHRLLNEPHSEYLQKKYNNFIIDEASQIKEYEKRNIFKLKHYRYIFCGDLGFQLPPVIDRQKFPRWKYPLMREMSKIGFDNEEHFTKIHRCKCPALLELLTYLRGLIEHRQEYKVCVPHLTKNIQKITTEELQKIYKKEDMILCSENKNKDEYTKMFSTIPKFMVKENTSKYNNNQIIFDDVPDIKKEHRHGFTIHSIQGETAQNKLFIDLRKQKSLRMIYTAISRAQYISQIYLI